MNYLYELFDMDAFTNSITHPTEIIFTQNAFAPMTFLKERRKCYMHRLIPLTALKAAATCHGTAPCLLPRMPFRRASSPRPRN